MTRINILPPKVLTNEHLLAEYKELPRVFTLSRVHHARFGTFKPQDAPDEYVLGAGHVKFFYDKLLWLLARYRALFTELQLRGYNPDMALFDRITHDVTRYLGQGWWRDQENPAFSPADYYLNMARLSRRSKDSRVISELAEK